MGEASEREKGRVCLVNYSVLLSVYSREKPEYLRQAMDSMWRQTVPTDDFVLVCDGPLTEELDAVIEDMQAAHTELQVIRLEKNGGLGNALNVGIRHCRNEIIARMDSDDISRPARCEKQLKAFAAHPEISLCSGIVEEFTGSPEKIESKRVPPETSEDILAFAKKRNPFNHPCMMYKKTAVQAVGGYRDFYLLEDYYLWVRMLQKGYAGYNIQESLLWMRAGSALFRRRAGRKYAKSQRALFRYMKETGFISGRQYIKSSMIRTASSLLPNCVRKLIYNKALRNTGT